ncbi:unnamed protein product [Spirodela intermedia]|uniref:Homeobox-leucine zipper protein n=1 Tax=Spirodela intermedia TaxID=51605 RepID=A0A7I8KVT1_SPIIN|nr:unnamed protein product [Spirodela intermedia]
MKRPSDRSSHSLVGATGGEELVSICRPDPEDERGQLIGAGDGEDCGEKDLSRGGVAGSGAGDGDSSPSATGEKKRRLSVQQVKALERNFEVENKLEPEKKVQLAKELGLQPRQVAVWFQNRRARWKTKQLERDYALLKSDYDSLQLSLEALRVDNRALLAEIKQLRAKLTEEEAPRPNAALAVKEEPAASASDNKVVSSEAEEEIIEAELEVDEVAPLPNFINKDGSSTDSSDSSDIVNANGEDNHTTTASHPHHRDMDDQFPSSDQHQLLGSPPSPMGPFDGGGTRCYPNILPFYQHSHFQLLSSSTPPPLPPLLRMADDHNFVVVHEPSSGNLFSDDQLPALHWCCPDNWS